MDREEQIELKLAFQKLIRSKWWKAYISILEDYSKKYSWILFRIDPALSELKYSTKDINLLFASNIDLLTAIPGLYIENMQDDSIDDLPLEKIVQNDYDRIMNEAKNIVNQSL
jgi:hypothetical protein